MANVTPIVLERPTADQSPSKTTNESPSALAPRKIDYLNIDSDSNYFDTREQVRLKGINWFTDLTAPTRLTGSNAVTGLFSQKRIVKDDAVYNSTSYATSSAVVDPSGASRKILALTNDYLASGSVDAYKNGIEITQEKHWTAGMVKITAGTPGHLYEPTLYGVPPISIVDPDKYFEIDVFDPIKFVELGGDPDLFEFPIITSDSNQLENFILNGIIEPFPIRPVISNFSINFPFEPHSTRGEYGNGNTHRMWGSDEVLTVDYYEPGRPDISPFLDAGESITIDGPTGPINLGLSQGYLSMDRKAMAPFEDVIYQRDTPPSSSYGADMLTALLAMPSGSGRMGSSYVTWKQKAATSGFVYDDAVAGTDSIAFGGRLY